MNRMDLLSKIILTCCFTFFITIANSNFLTAQVLPDITLSSKPEYPKIGEPVIMILDSSEVNLEYEYISWYVNDQLVSSGQAKTSIQVNTNTGDGKYIVRAMIGKGINPVIKEFTISPGSVIVLWEAVQSYVPSWYKGKKLAGKEAVVRVTAVPVGGRSLTGYFFLWKYGNRTESSQSGFGKNTIIIRKSLLLGDVPVSVTVSSSGGEYSAQGSVVVPGVDPDLRLWAPRFVGMPIFTKKGYLILPDREATVLPIPYYMNTKDASRGIGYSWNLNDQEYTPPEEEGTQGGVYINSSAQSISLTAQNIYSITEEAKASVRVLFK
jgi:hypothetical protein